MKNPRQAFVIPVLVWWLAGGFAASQVLLPSWRVTNLFAKGSGADALTKAQADLKTKADAAALAEAHYNAALSDFEAKKGDILRNSLFNLSGVPLALAKEPQTPGVVLASGLANRASMALKDAGIDLPKPQQDAIAQIVADMLSADSARIKAAEDALAAKDAELAETNKVKEQLAAQIPPLKAQATAAVVAANVAQTIVTAKTQQVVAYAKQAELDKAEAGGLKAFGENLVKFLVLTALIAVCLLMLYLYLKFHSVGINGLASIVSDIRAGVDPVHAIDTVTNPATQAAIAAIATPAKTS